MVLKSVIKSLGDEATILSPSPLQLHYVTYEDLRFLVHNVLVVIVINITRIKLFSQAGLVDTYSSRDYSPVWSGDVFTRVRDFGADRQHAVKSLGSTLVVFAIDNFLDFPKSNLQKRG